MSQSEPERRTIHVFDLDAENNVTVRPVTLLGEPEPNRKRWSVMEAELGPALAKLDAMERQVNGPNRAG